MCLLFKVNRPVPTRSMKKSLHEELGSSYRSVKPEKLSENIRVKQLTMEQGNLWSKTAQAHTQ